MISLTKDFNTAARNFERDMQDLRVTLGASWEKFIGHVPVWEPGKWQGSANNCYNFAIDQKTNDYRQPGNKHVNPKLDLQEYADIVHDKACGDGLRFLGGSFSACRPGEVPVALFFNESAGWSGNNRDYHWIALRRNGEGDKASGLLWAHKMGGNPALRCSNHGKSTDPFSTAQQVGYMYFAGYYAVPMEQKPP